MRRLTPSLMLAHYRVAHGLPGISINWGAWSEVGMAATLNKKQQERLQAQGIRMIAPDQGVQLLEQIMRHPQAQVAVIAADRRYWQTPDVDLPALLKNLVEARSADQQAEVVNGESARERILNAPSDARSQLLRDFLQQQIAAVVGSSVEALDTSVPIISLGIDSLMAVEIRNRVDKHLRLNMLVASILEGPSILQMAQTLGEQLGSENEPAMDMVAVSDGEVDWEEGEL